MCTMPWWTQLKTCDLRSGPVILFWLFFCGFIPPELRLGQTSDGRTGTLRGFIPANLRTPPPPKKKERQQRRPHPAHFHIWKRRGIQEDSMALPSGLTKSSEALNTVHNLRYGSDFSQSMLPELIHYESHLRCSCWHPSVLRGLFDMNICVHMFIAVGQFKRKNLSSRLTLLRIR